MSIEKNQVMMDARAILSTDRQAIGADVKMGIYPTQPALDIHCKT